MEKEITERIAELFKAFGDPTRVQILSLLAQQERCVGDIAEAIDKIHKYQVAFSERPKKEQFNVEFIKYQQDERIIKVVVKEDLEEFSRKIQKFNPLIIDEINIDFEELFIIEVESKGYLK